MKITKKQLRKLIRENSAIPYSSMEEFKKGIRDVSSVLKDMQGATMAFRSMGVSSEFASIMASLQRINAAVEQELSVSHMNDSEIRANRRERDAYMMDAMNADETYQDYDYSPADKRGWDEY